jgi:uncharacterized protein (PEP-CTERM system associated)
MGAPLWAQPALWVEGRVGAGVTLTSNGAQSAAWRSDQVLEINPGIRVVANGARVKGALDYSLRGLHHLQDTSGDSLRHALNAQGVVEVWDGRAFVDLSGTISDQTVSAFGPLGGSGVSNTNRSETTSFRFSPYLKGRLAGAADYEVRYAWATSDTRNAGVSDQESQDLSLRLLGRVTGPLGWSLLAQSATTDYSQDRETRSDSVRLNLNYTLTPQLMLTAVAGTERNDVLSVQRESYGITGVGLDWRPSPRSRASFDLQDRYFGHSHNLQLEHRTGRTVWRLRDTRDASNSPTQAATAALGTLYDLIDALFVGLETDPVKRDQLVQAELLKLGFPGDTLVFQSFLSSSATLARTQSLSAILQGRRTVWTASLNRSRTSRLQSVITLGDDFDNNSYVLQQGLSLAVAHRLTPQTSLSADWSLQRNEGSAAGQTTRLQTLTLRLNTQLAPRTSGSLQLRRSVQDSPTSPYGETAVSGMVNHRF